jgi:hypothetical protein
MEMSGFAYAESARRSGQFDRNLLARVSCGYGFRVPRFRLRAPRSRLREAHPRKRLVLRNRFGGRSKVGGLQTRRSSHSERRRVAQPRNDRTYNSKSQNSLTTGRPQLLCRCVRMSRNPAFL